VRDHGGNPGEGESGIRRVARPSVLPAIHLFLILGAPFYRFGRTGYPGQILSWPPASILLRTLSNWNEHDSHQAALQKLVGDLKVSASNCRMDLMSDDVAQAIR
jgi:hypothetical protein